MDVDALRAALADTGTPLRVDIVETVLSMARPAAELDVDGEGVPVGTYGGLPALPAGVDWPSGVRQPLTLLAQLDCAALAALLGDAWTLPRAGTLLCFYDELLGLENEPCRVVHVDGAAPVRPAPDGAVVIGELPLSGTLRLSLPDRYGAELKDVFLADPPSVFQLNDELIDLLPYSPHQVLGWLGEGYHPEYPGYRPLLQLEAEAGTGAAWGECVRIAFLLPEDGDLDRARIAYEVA